MENLIKEKYEAPTTKRTRVEMESGICVASNVDVKPGDDVSTNRHVTISPQEGGIGFGEDAWSGSSFE
ncbi:MAG: hypothetical protein H9789_05595 [Candidatus Paraprevotella stercoravium]|uniref:Uncharacterized protein n=1 Tax=Candidatus Paraprevotella stercoravium TaxID=2838725 RepID=A0A9E2P1R6_9BACT|nr:hypothetical protein [Candidatus Phocaeicola merdigallinarum]MBU3853281.1 hypothetical protein [Candidatus Paraprevotella stercoravium]